jgi:hypothetical protein
VADILIDREIVFGVAISSIMAEKNVRISKLLGEANDFFSRFVEAPVINGFESGPRAERVPRFVTGHCFGDTS